MTKKQRTVLLAVVTLMLCLALVAGGTYALFSAQVEMTNHLQAGKMNVTLERTHLYAFALDPVTGYMIEHDADDTPHKQFTNGTTDNVFGITGETLIVPCSEYTATMRITNNGDVAFGYWLQIKFKDAEGHVMTDEQLDALDLDDQIEVKLNDQTVVLGEGLSIGGGPNDDYAGRRVAKASTLENPHPYPSYSEFTISVKFLNLENDVNNLAKEEKISFDLIVHAVQLPETAPVVTTP